MRVSILKLQEDAISSHIYLLGICFEKVDIIFLHQIRLDNPIMYRSRPSLDLHCTSTIFAPLLLLCLSIAAIALHRQQKPSREATCLETGTSYSYL